MPHDFTLALRRPASLMAGRGAPRALAVALIALAVFALLLLVDGKDPLRAYRDTLLYVFGNAYGFSELLVRMSPLLLTSVAVALPSRLGLINVGGEGQLYMGAWFATASALGFSDLPAWQLLPLMTDSPSWLWNLSRVPRLPPSPVFPCCPAAEMPAPPCQSSPAPGSRPGRWWTRGEHDASRPIQSIRTAWGRCPRGKR
jgi:hypothetical protein